VIAYLLEIFLDCGALYRKDLLKSCLQIESAHIAVEALHVKTLAST
jgi:hypothetical protein